MAARKTNNDYDIPEGEFYNTNDKEHIYNEYYVDGNTVRRVQPDQDGFSVPDRRQQEEVERRREKRTRTSRKADKELSSVSKGACLVLIVSIALTLIVCIDYINTQASLSVLNGDIIQMEKDLSNLKEENKIGREQLNANLDLDRIYNIAVAEYGMVRPSDGQIIYFDSTLSDFVKQYKEIPEQEQSNITDLITN